MGFLGVVLAAFAGFGVGALWYGSLSQKWLAAVGRTKEDIQADKSPLPFVIAAVAALLAAGTMRHAFLASGIDGAVRSGVYGAGIGAFLVAPWVVLHHAFAGRPVSLWWIDAGHVIAAFAAMGVVLGLWF